MIYSLIVALAVSVCFILLFIFKNKISQKNINTILKIAAVGLFTLGVLRNFLNDNFVWVINGGTYLEVYYDKRDIIQSLLRWGHYLSYVVLPCAVFFKIRTYKNFAIYFCFFISFIELFFFNKTMSYFLTDSGCAINTAVWFRYVEYMLELFICLIIPLVLRFIQKHKFDIKNKKERAYFLGLLPLALLIVMPVYLPQSILGFTEIYMKPLTIPNFAWIIFNLIIIVIIYFAFRFKSYECRYSVLVFLALLVFLHYNSIYMMDLLASRLPFQLCNLGAYLVLIALLIKKQGFFDFVLLANVPGATIALVAVDVEGGLLSFWNIHYYIEHTWIFVIPVLAVALRIFKRPGKNSIKHLLIGYTIYFIVCSVSGIILNSFFYDPTHAFFNKVNYFFLFDTKVASYLPFLGFTRNYPVVLNEYLFYPLYMILIYILFFIYCLMFNYVYKIFTKIADDHFHLRQIKINMRKENGYYEKHNKKVPQLDYDEKGDCHVKSI